MDSTETRAWLHHCGTLVPGDDEAFCPGCRTDVRHSEQVEARYTLVPDGGDAPQRITGALREAERARFALILRDPGQYEAVAAVVRSEASRDPVWFGSVLRRALRLVPAVRHE